MSWNVVLTARIHNVRPVENKNVTAMKMHSSKKLCDEKNNLYSLESQRGRIRYTIP